MLFIHRMPDGSAEEVAFPMYLFLQTDMMMLPENYEGHSLCEILPPDLDDDDSECEDYDWPSLP